VATENARLENAGPKLYSGAKRGKKACVDSYNTAYFNRLTAYSTGTHMTHKASMSACMGQMQHVRRVYATDFTEILFLPSGDSAIFIILSAASSVSGYDPSSRKTLLCVCADAVADRSCSRLYVPLSHLLMYVLTRLSNRNARSFSKSARSSAVVSRVSNEKRMNHCAVSSQ